MNKNEKGFSMVIVVIFMSIAALFIGYLMGSWLISFLVEDNSQELAEDNNPALNQQLAKETAPKEEVNNRQNNLSTPEEKTDNLQNNNENNTAANKTEEKVEQSSNSAVKIKEETPAPPADNQSPEKSQDSPSFAVQIGAFSNYQNALSLKNTVEEMGYNVIISDSAPHQVKVSGYPSREKAELILEELKSEGYNGFIVLRE